MTYRIGRVIGSHGASFRAHSTSKPDELRDKSGINVGARRNYDHEQDAVKKAEDDKKKREDLIKQRNQEAQRRMKDTMREEMDSKGTEARTKIKNVSRPNDPEPTSIDSKLSKTGQIKTKIIDEEKPLMSDKTLGLPGGLIAAARAVMEKKHDTDDTDARKLTGSKTKVDLEPETDDDLRSDDEKKMKKTVKEAKDATHPKTEKEKKLAALAHPKDKITHKDVLVGRGVLAKEEVDLESLTEEELEEVLKKSQPAGEWIKDFVHSKDPKFAGKSKKKRMQMALGAYYAKQRNEEIEIDEASMFSSKVKQGKGAAADIGSARYDFGKNAAPRRPDDTGKNVLSRRVFVKGAKPKGKLPEEVEIDEAAGSVPSTKKKTSSAPAVTKKIDFDKVKQVRDARKAAKQARHTDTSHLPPGWKTTWTRNEETDMELTDEELERLNEIAAQLDEKITPSELRAQLKAKAAAKKTSDSEAKSTTKEEVDLDEAKRGRPRKNPAPDQAPGEDEEHEHVIMQLRKVVSTHGALPVKHLDGKSTKMTPQLAQHALNKHNAMKTAAEKQDFEHKLHKSHDSMKTALSG